jgi:hypothetical protein
MSLGKGGRRELGFVPPFLMPQACHCRGGNSNVSDFLHFGHVTNCFNDEMRITKKVWQRVQKILTFFIDRILSPIIATMFTDFTLLGQRQRKRNE